MECKEARRAVVFSSILGSLVGFPIAAGAAVINISHASKIKKVPQGNANLCWLASSAMMESWKADGKGVSMEAVAKKLGEPYLGLYKEGQKNPDLGSLNLTAVRDLAKKIGLRTGGLKSLTVDWWVKQVTAGPIFVAGYTKGTLGHAIVLIGLEGEPVDFAMLKATVIDPNGGLQKSMPLTTLIKFYEGLAPSAADPRVVAPQLLFY